MIFESDELWPKIKQRTVYVLKYFPMGTLGGKLVVYSKDQEYMSISIAGLWDFYNIKCFTRYLLHKECQFSSSFFKLQYLIK